jgi:hypothetical protein
MVYTGRGCSDGRGGGHAVGHSDGRNNSHGNDDMPNAIQHDKDEDDITEHQFLLDNNLNDSVDAYIFLN